MKQLKINEIFYSLQGEGERVGEASIFIRLSGCDLTCGFCDTEFESGRVMTLDELHSKITRWPGRFIVWTGGEPMLQLDREAVIYFRGHGFRQAVESNGNHPIPTGWFDWTVVSPKVAEHVLAKNFPDGVDELRYVRHAGQQMVPSPSIKAKCHFISPMFKGDRPDPENIVHCINLCLENPTWRLSIQTHKLFKIL